MRGPREGCSAPGVHSVNVDAWNSETSLHAFQGTALVARARGLHESRQSIGVGSVDVNMGHRKKSPHALDRTSDIAIATGWMALTHSIELSVPQ